MNLDRIKDTVRKLLNLAENDAATEGEVRNALTFAQRLMDQHNLSEDDLPKADERLLEIEKAECGQFDAFTGSKSVAMWEKTLASFVSKFTNVPCFLHAGTDTVRKCNIAQLDDNGEAKKARRFVFYGLVEDAQFATQLYDELRVTLASIARLKYGGVYRGSGREYCEGFAMGLYSQLEQTPTTSDCTALVVKRNEIVAAKQTRARAYLREQGVRLRKSSTSRSVTKSDKNAYESGRTDGANYKVSNERQRRLA